MRAIQIALFLICFQIGMGIVTESGMFTGTYFESSIANPQLTGNFSATEESEQVLGSVSIMNKLWNVLTWGWITRYFEPWYSNNTAVHNFVDHIVLFLNTLSGVLIGVAFIEFIRNRLNVLG